MIIEEKIKYFLLLLIMLITGCDDFLGHQEPPFIVYGDESVLKDTIINVNIIMNDRNHPGNLLYKTRSLLYKGDVYPISFRRDDDIIHYVIFYSNNNKINTLSFDAVIPWLKVKKRNAQVIVVKNMGKILVLNIMVKNSMRIMEGLFSLARWSFPKMNFSKKTRCIDMVKNFL